MDDVSSKSSEQLLGEYFPPNQIMSVTATDPDGNTLTEGAGVWPQLTPLDKLPEYEGLPVISINAVDGWQVSFPVREAEKDTHGSVTLVGPKGTAVFHRLASVDSESEDDSGE